MVHLPNELMLMILSYLEKRDAKACRLASRKWTDLTIPFIFNRIWISARTRDIAAFHEWTSNPRLANAVTSIYYDAAWLPFEANEELYVRLLCYQISLRYQAMGDDRTIDLVLPELMELHKNMHFIHEPDNRHSRKSLRYWTKHPLVKMAYARFETDTRSAAVLVQTRTLMHIISQGLKRLPKLSSAHFSDNHATIDRNFIFWDHRCNNPTGPPHMRSLSVVNLYPFTRDEAHLLGGSYGCYWATSPVDHRENSAEFGIFLEAISVARAPIQHLNVCRDSRLGVDLFSPGLKDVAAKHFAPVISRLSSLYLHLHRIKVILGEVYNGRYQVVKFTTGDGSILHDWLLCDHSESSNCIGHVLGALDHLEELQLLGPGIETCDGRQYFGKPYRLDCILSNSLQALYGLKRVFLRGFDTNSQTLARAVSGCQLEKIALDEMRDFSPQDETRIGWNMEEIRDVFAWRSDIPELRWYLESSTQRVRCVVWFSNSPGGIRLPMDLEEVPRNAFLFRDLYDEGWNWSRPLPE